MADAPPRAATQEAAIERLDKAEFRSRLDRLLDRIGNSIAYLFAIAAAITFIEVFNRYLLDAPTLWVHETVIMLVALSFAYGGVYCLARNTHIRIVLIYDHVGPRTRRVLDILNASLTLAFALGIAYAAWLMLDKSLFTPSGDFRLETSGSAWNPPIPPIVKGGLFLSTALMTVQSALHLLAAIIGKKEA